MSDATITNTTLRIRRNRITEALFDNRNSAELIRKTNKQFIERVGEVAERGMRLGLSRSQSSKFSFGVQLDHIVANCS